MDEIIGFVIFILELGAATVVFGLRPGVSSAVIGVNLVTSATLDTTTLVGAIHLTAGIK